jgi:hypothetical protein
MRKIQVFGLMLVAVFAMSVVVASAASAEVSLWLKKAESIESGTLATEGTGLLELTDLNATGGAVTVNCKGILDGWVGPNGTGETIKILTSTGGETNTENLIECEVVSGKEGACETSMLADVIPLGLPWTLTLELMSSPPEYLLVIVPLKGTVLGYMVTCLTILGETLDECSQTEATQELNNLTSSVEGVSKEEDTGNCTIGGSKEGDILGSGVVTLNNKEALAVSMP